MDENGNEIHGNPRMGTDYSKDAFQSNRHYGQITGPAGLTGPPRAKSEYYSVSLNPDQAFSQAVARKKCLSCNTDDLKPEYIYCPNCGLLFI